MLFWRSIERIIDIWEFMHPTKTLVTVFDNSSGHRAYRETARNAGNMNIGEGGWHTVWPWGRVGLQLCTCFLNVFMIKRKICEKDLFILWNLVELNWIIY